MLQSQVIGARSAPWKQKMQLSNMEEVAMQRSSGYPASNSATDFVYSRAKKNVPTWANRERCLALNVFVKIFFFSNLQSLELSVQRPKIFTVTFAREVTVKKFGYSGQKRAESPPSCFGFPKNYEFENCFFEPFSAEPGKFYGNFHILFLVREVTAEKFGHSDRKRAERHFFLTFLKICNFSTLAA